MHMHTAVVLQMDTELERYLLSVALTRECFQVLVNTSGENKKNTVYVLGKCVALSAVGQKFLPHSYVLSREPLTEDDCVKLLDKDIYSCFTGNMCLEELVAVLRVRYPSLISHSGVLSHNEIVLDRGKRTVYVLGNQIFLTNKEFNLLELFLQDPGRAFTRLQILNACWGVGALDLYDRSIDPFIVRVRRKIRKYTPTKYITTVHSYGYRLV